MVHRDIKPMNILVTYMHSWRRNWRCDIVRVSPLTMPTAVLYSTTATILEQVYSWRVIHNISMPHHFIYQSFTVNWRACNVKCRWEKGVSVSPTIHQMKMLDISFGLSQEAACVPLKRYKSFSTVHLVLNVALFRVYCMHLFMYNETLSKWGTKSTWTMAKYIP